MLRPTRYEGLIGKENMKSIYKLTFVLPFRLAMSLSALAQRPGDQAPSSILVYNLYASSLTDPSQRDTNLSITNVNNSQAAWVHLFLVANSCAVADFYVCLTANQTTSLLASDIDPGIMSYAIAINFSLTC